MLNGEGNENGIKINRSNQQRNKLHVQHTFFLISKNTNLHMQHTLIFGFLCHCFAQLQLMLFCRTKTSNFLVTHYFMEKLSYNMCLPNTLSPVFMHDCFYFSLPLIFTLLAASISHSHNHFEFSCFPSYKICLFCFQSLAVALSLLST